MNDDITSTELTRVQLHQRERIDLTLKTARSALDRVRQCSRDSTASRYVGVIYDKLHAAEQLATMAQQSLEHSRTRTWIYLHDAEQQLERALNDLDEALPGT